MTFFYQIVSVWIVTDNFSLTSHSDAFHCTFNLISQGWETTRGNSLQRYVPLKYNNTDPSWRQDDNSSGGEVIWWRKTDGALKVRTRHRAKNDLRVSAGDSAVAARSFVLAREKSRGQESGNKQKAKKIKQKKREREKGTSLSRDAARRPRQRGKYNSTWRGVTIRWLHASRVPRIRS